MLKPWVLGGETGIERRGGTLKRSIGRKKHRIRERMA